MKKINFKNFNFKKLYSKIKFSHILVIVLFVVIFAEYYIESEYKNVFNTNTESEELITLLNDYEGVNILDFQTDEDGDTCLYSYDVGDGVYTYGLGNAFNSKEVAIDTINDLTDSTYSVGDCIKFEDLETLQADDIDDRVEQIMNLDQQYETNITSKQLDGILLMFYLNESTIKDENFWIMLQDPYLSKEEYITYFTNEFSQFQNYDTFKNGWINRINDSADVFFDGEYNRDY